jgi:hypothetical protein
MVVGVQMLIVWVYGPCIVLTNVSEKPPTSSYTSTFKMEAVSYSETLVTPNIAQHINLDQHLNSRYRLFTFRDSNRESSIYKPVTSFDRQLVISVCFSTVIFHGIFPSER